MARGGDYEGEINKLKSCHLLIWSRPNI